MITLPVLAAAAMPPAVPRAKLQPAAASVAVEARRTRRPATTQALLTCSLGLEDLERQAVLCIPAGPCTLERGRRRMLLRWVDHAGPGVASLSTSLMRCLLARGVLRHDKPPAASGGRSRPVVQAPASAP